ncbi:hypothetical protein M436DRAFT_40520 [Aureobasidium namibiae CBS 147.97]|uniref:Uncharacterized protein n=1 Tax=Aureobasidium namibiae CBS 147.97 TaxID=1043004 RepID=A0A074WXR5_9PEZI
MELLAHASAPSSRKDDERFKRQANAYLSFEPSSIVPIHKSQTDSETRIPAAVPSSVSVDHEEPPVFLSNTQDAWTALDSQLFAPSQQPDDQSIQESDLDQSIDDSVLPLPIDSSLPPRVSLTLPPDDSTLLVTSATQATNPPSHRSLGRTGSRRRVQYVPTPSRNLQSDEQESPSYLDGLSTVYSAETPVRRVSTLRTSNLPLPQDDFSSPSDDIPSQLPSTYSISDINSDPIRSDQDDAPTSSAWGSLPRGSAPQPWNGIIYEESPLKGVRSSGKRRAIGSSPLKQTQSTESPRANMSAHVKSTQSGTPLGQSETSSASLNRMVISKQQQQQLELARRSFTSDLELRGPSSSQARERIPGNGFGGVALGFRRHEDTISEVTRSSFESRFSSEPQAHGTQPGGVDDSTDSPMLRRQDLNQVLPTSFESRFSSSPEAQGTPSVGAGDMAVPPPSRPDLLNQLPPTSFESRFSSSPDAHGTPFVQSTNSREKPAEASSSPSSKIDLFQPRPNHLPIKAMLASSSAVESGVLKSAAALSKPGQWLPTSSASEPSSAIIERAMSETAVDYMTPTHPSLIEKRPLPSSRVPESTIGVKRRKFASLSTPKSKANTQEKEIFKSLPTQIHPPPPPTGSDTFISHITPQLKSQFWDSEELQGKYKPFPHRALRQSERGYWQFDTRSWSPRIQIKFWVFLQSNIGSGVSGWGIWCLRENDATGNEGEEDGDKEHELGIVKVFCWGEVVGHVWLLCYVASQARLKRVESQWVDADGAVVVRI